MERDDVDDVIFRLGAIEELLERIEVQLIRLNDTIGRAAAEDEEDSEEGDPKEEPRSH